MHRRRSQKFLIVIWLLQVDVIEFWFGEGELRIISQVYSFALQNKEKFYYVKKLSGMDE